MADMIKVDDTTVKIPETEVTIQKEQFYTLSNLYDMKKNFESKKTAITADLDKKIAAVDALIAEALALGVKTDAEVAEVVVEVKP